MKRRELIALLGGAAATSSVSWPLAARAQQGGRVRRIGILMNVAASDPEGQAQVAALVLQLKELGWTDGRNVAFDYRWAAGDANRMRTFAKELVDLQPDVILARSTPATAALQRETQAIPIVFVASSDPVGEGFVANVARPGTNITGFSNVESSMGGKWLELLKEIAPGITRVALIFNPPTAPGGGSYYIRLVESAAPSRAVALIQVPVHDPAEIEPALAALAREPSVGLIVLPDVLTNVHRELIISRAARYRLPAVYAFRYMAADGGLMSYGIDLVDLFRRSASYVDRILKGAKPADLPCPAADQVRAGDQPQDREGARPDGTADQANDRR
jgi:putative ABC transport system substrate-binding protein